MAPVKPVRLVQFVLSAVVLLVSHVAPSWAQEMDTEDRDALNALQEGLQSFDANEIKCERCESYKDATICCNENGRVISVSLHSRGLKGIIKDRFCNLPELLSLDLSGNHLTGEIPKTIGQMTNLQSLHLNDNQLSGGIPPTIGKLTRLTDLYLGNNLLSGSIPTTLEFTNLYNLDLKNNLLTGAIPSTIARLSNLQSLQLSSNALIGVVDLQFQKLGSVNIDLGSNYLSGNRKITLNGEAFRAKIDSNCFLSENEVVENQRDISECESFCHATQPMGACGGHGYCTPGDYATCTCDQGYRNNLDPFTCSFETRGLGLLGGPSSQPTKKNTFFRYASYGYIYLNEKTPASWMVATNWLWANAGAVQQIQDQKNYSTCWAFAAASAIESAVYIANGGNGKLPIIAAEQFVHCPNKFLTSGGFPTDALDYAAKTPLVFNVKSFSKKDCANIRRSSALTISSFEEVKVYGWMGLLLALQQQPSIVNIEASGLSFANYKEGIFDDADCFSNGVDHSVVVVGYDLTSSPPYWVIRNSWGPHWGESGYMRLMITGGLGICGINSLPALIPIVKNPSRDPCNSVNYAASKLGNSIGPGLLNPCGSGVCTVSGTKNRCKCSKPFVAVDNTDGSQTCAPASPCTFDFKNPCGVGSCMDLRDPKGAYSGTYTCLCPPGYRNDSTTGSQTCVLDGSEARSLVIPHGVHVTCYNISLIYGISLDVFSKQNKGINCTTPLPPGTTLDVTNSRKCSLLYSVNEGDTCGSIAGLFNMAGKEDDLKAVNPGLDCTQLLSFQQICIEREDLPTLAPCTLWYDVKEGDTCLSIISKKLNGDIRLFYTLNPGVFCGSLLFGSAGMASIGQQVCLAANDISNKCVKYPERKLLTNCQSCGSYDAINVDDSDTCKSIKTKCFPKGTPKFRTLNGYACTPANLKSVRKICVPKRTDSCE